MQPRENVDLRHFNTFHVSAKARWFVEVLTNAELREALLWARERNINFQLIGKGSNILFKRDYPGLIIELHTRGMEVEREDREEVRVRVMAGEVWHDLVRYCLTRGYYGLENLSLIPGTVGAAPVQNIGAYGVEIREFIHELEALEIATGNAVRFSNAECGFGYRTSVFKEALQGQFVITSVSLALSKNPQPRFNYPDLARALAEVAQADITPQLVSDTVCSIRRSKLPDPVDLGNAGSFFRNPVVNLAQYNTLAAQWQGLPGYHDDDKVKIPAAWLIEKAGWKGHREGDVGVHRQHALVLVNYGEATGAQLLALSTSIQESVESHFGIRLEPEVRII